VSAAQIGSRGLRRRAGDEPLVLKGIDRDDFIPAVTGHGEASEIADSIIERWLALG